MWSCIFLVMHNIWGLNYAMCYENYDCTPLSPCCPCALPHSPALALHASGLLSHALPGVPLSSPVCLVPFSFIVTVYTLVPGPLALTLVYIAHVTTLFTSVKSISLLPSHFQSLRALFSPPPLAFSTSLHSMCSHSDTKPTCC
jgi:hypothetical protein